MVKFFSVGGEGVCPELPNSVLVRPASTSNFFIHLFVSFMLPFDG